MHLFTNHIPFSLIADFVEGRAAPDAEAQAHLAVCASCAANQAWLSRTLGILRADSSEAPAERAVADVKALFRTRPPRPAPRPGPLVALLRFDSATARPAFGLRSAAAAERQLLFSAGPYELDLRVVPVGSRWTLAGQVLGTHPVAHGHVEILGSADRDRAELSPESEFVLKPLRPGTYSLSLTLDGESIVLHNVELGA